MYCSSPDCDSCNPERLCEECDFWYRGYCRECYALEAAIPVEFPFNTAEIQKSIDSGVISFPKGLDHEERLDFIREKLKEIDNE